MNTEQVVCGLTWKLEFNELFADQSVAAECWQSIDSWLQKNNALDTLVSVMSGALVETELQVLLNPQEQEKKSYEEAFSNWISLVSFIRQHKKSDVTTASIRQATSFLTKHCPEVQSAVIFSQMRKRLCLWCEPLESKNQQKDWQYVMHWLQKNPYHIKQLISEIGQALVASELKILLSHTAEQASKVLAKAYWHQLIDYIKNHYNPEILDQIFQSAAHFLTAPYSLPSFEQQSQEVSNDSDQLSRNSWRWRPVLPHENEEVHSEYARQSLHLPQGLQMIAARVRGKKHKHDGSHCDDWFEIAQSGDWGIIAVADGAGARMFSPVGAKVACQTAVNYLSDKLKTHQLTPRKIWNVNTFARDQDYQFEATDIELTQTWLHEAIQAAYQAVSDTYHTRDNLKYHYKALDHQDLTLNDFATTLVLTIHTTIPYQSVNYSFVLSCQIGDGLAAAIYKSRPKTSVLTAIEPDHLSGETEFLTTAEQRITRQYLARKTFPFFSPLRALLVMTDGVANDYLPPQSGMLRLFCDLVINQIIPVKPSSTHLLSTKSKNQLATKKSHDMLTERQLTETGETTLFVNYASEYAKLINQPLEQLVAKPELLVPGIPTELATQQTPLENRLQTWLDAYHYRGSFDDRTLVVLFHC